MIRKSSTNPRSIFVGHGHLLSITNPPFPVVIWLVSPMPLASLQVSDRDAHVRLHPRNEMWKILHALQHLALILWHTHIAQTWGESLTIGKGALTSDVPSYGDPGWKLSFNLVGCAAGNAMDVMDAMDAIDAMATMQHNIGKQAVWHCASKSCRLTGPPIGPPMYKVWWLFTKWSNWK